MYNNKIDIEPAKCVTKSGQGLMLPRTEAAFPLCTATDKSAAVYLINIDFCEILNTDKSQYSTLINPY